MPVRPGIEVLLDTKRDLIKGARVGAVVHPASILSDCRHTGDALLAAGDFQLKALLGPQHGARGEKQDNMIESDFYRDPDTGLPVHSLYGETRRPTTEMLQDIDVLLFDLGQSIPFPHVLNRSTETPAASPMPTGNPLRLLSWQGCRPFARPRPFRLP